MLQVNPHPGWFLAAALADLVENNIHLTSLGLEWNSIGMVESGMQRLCHVRHCKASARAGAWGREPLYQTHEVAMALTRDLISGDHAEFDFNRARPTEQRHLKHGRRGPGRDALQEHIAQAN